MSFNFIRSRRKRHRRQVKFAGLLPVSESLIDLAVERMKNSLINPNIPEGLPKAIEEHMKTRPRVSHKSTLTHEEVINFLKETLPQNISDRLHMLPKGDATITLNLVTDGKLAKSANTFEFYEGEWVNQLKELRIFVPPDEVENPSIYIPRLKETLVHELRHVIQYIANLALGKHEEEWKEKGGYGVEKSKSTKVRDQVQDRRVGDGYWLDPLEYQPWLGSVVDMMTTRMEDLFNRLEDDFREFAWFNIPREDKRKEALKIANEILRDDFDYFVNTPNPKFNFLATLKRRDAQRYQKALKYIYLELTKRAEQWVDANEAIWND